ncbi:hypothetical protein E3N88_01688 [Mikania micrantha]|uniref:Uncharacterized protein n=1 Tax=Mikania micrantha TaxID=192012 RepID=A0A5N6Q1W6_9ASTR|nr:hypothetical protein E3N88_01688 [Mikania micrantha]
MLCFFSKFGFAFCCIPSNRNRHLTADLLWWRRPLGNRPSNRPPPLVVSTAGAVGVKRRPEAVLVNAAVDEPKRVEEDEILPWMPNAGVDRRWWWWWWWYAAAGALGGGGGMRERAGRKKGFLLIGPQERKGTVALNTVDFGGLGERTREVRGFRRSKPLAAGASRSRRTTI